MANDTNVERPSIWPFYLIVADHDRGLFSVEGPMTDDQPWMAAAQRARNRQRRVVCGPAGPNPPALAVDYQKTHKLAGVPPGSIVRVANTSMRPRASRNHRPWPR